MGDLVLFITASDATFIGSGLAHLEGRNILEATLGSAVVFGPLMFNFYEIKMLFIQQQTSVEVESAVALVEQIAQWLGFASERSRIGETGRELMAKKRGHLIG